MAKRNSSGDLAGIIVAVTLFLPIIAIIYLVKGIIYLIIQTSKEKAKKDEERIYKDLLNTNIQEQLIEVDNLDGLQFEKYIGELLKKIGFKKVIVTKGSGDFGADIVAEKENDKYAFQCKRFETAIGPKPIGEVLRGMNKYKCNKGVVVTNNYFTKQAIQEASVSNIELWDRDKLSTLIGNNGNNPINKENYVTLEDDKTIEEKTDIIENAKEGNTIKMKEQDSLKKEYSGNNKLTNLKYVDLIAGYYEVDEDIEEGKYLIEVTSGSGVLHVNDKDKNLKVSECMGKNISNFIPKYNNLKLKTGDIIQIEGAVTLRFKKIA